MTTKAVKIAELLDQGTPVKDIVGTLDTTQSYVYSIKAELAKIRKEDGTDEVDSDHAQITSKEEDFVTKVQITPDKEVLTDTKKETESTTETYICNQCGKEWTADAKEYQVQCPGCGTEF